jgi:CBS domain containing-hemolysin-like protein
MALNPGLTVAGSVGILVLTPASAFFSSSELAIFSPARHRVGALAAEGTRAGTALGALPSDCW